MFLALYRFIICWSVRRKPYSSVWWQSASWNSRVLSFFFSSNIAVTSNISWQKSVPVDIILDYTQCVTICQQKKYDDSCYFMNLFKKKRKKKSWKLNDLYKANSWGYILKLKHEGLQNFPKQLGEFTDIWSAMKSVLLLVYKKYLS